MAVITVLLSDRFEDWRTKTNQISAGVGDLSLLSESIAETLVGIQGNIGDLNNLLTTDKTSLVAAINETKRGSLALAIALG